ncbi:DUF2065 domain-containing protein [Catenovulum maritimum]|uniref:Membrane protein n=1 Tax=Catenovulum maritimum TaxID=1513271 RepID=A0A0J8GNL3_9ALTE|nr:DUF2065 domain-containing protein [Catenovulum maritimum]KMT64377.1 membrane protein [Catenovulum maritimum]
MDWLKVIALVLIVEGIAPFLIPNKWKNYMLQVATMPAKQLRQMGFILLLIGTIILWIS